MIVTLTHGMAVLFGGAGVMSYLTFGANVQTVVIVNFDLESKMVQAVCRTYDKLSVV